MDDAPADWRRALTWRFARAIVAARDEKGLSVADVAARTGGLLSRDVITNYEVERKKSIDLADVILIAAALDVSPLTLIFPDVHPNLVEYLPGRVVNTPEAIDAFCGMESNVRELMSLRNALEAISDALGKLPRRPDAPRVWITQPREKQ